MKWEFVNPHDGLGEASSDSDDFSTSPHRNVTRSRKRNNFEGMTELRVRKEAASVKKGRSMNSEYFDIGIAFEAEDEALGSDVADSSLEESEPYHLESSDGLS